MEQAPEALQAQQGDSSDERSAPVGKHFVGVASDEFQNAITVGHLPSVSARTHLLDACTRSLMGRHPSCWSGLTASLTPESAQW